MMVKRRPINRIHWSRWMLVLAALTALVLVACGSAAEPQQAAATSPPAATIAPLQIPAATAAPSDSGKPVPTAAPKATAVPEQMTSSRDSATLVTEAEPASVGAWSEGCSAEIHSFGCQEFVSDHLTWLDDRTSEIVPLSGVESWSQLAPDEWQFKLRAGVKFHNGAPWNAEEAAYAMEFNADPTGPSSQVSWLGTEITAEAVDELTVNINCGSACPIFPRVAFFSDFQPREWYENATLAQQSGMTIGFGPYRIIDYKPGVHTKFEIYEDYLPNENFFAQAPHIQFLKHVYRNEATVRAAMIQTGEAEWAADIGFDEIGRVPKAVTGKTAEVYLLVLDTVFHPELKKQKVRQALAEAIDCETLISSLFGDQMQCHAAISMAGTVGITEENSKVRPYDPDHSRQLLAEAGYDPDNEININTRPGSNIRGAELMEATIQFWRDIGVNANLNSWGDLGKAREIQNSGCGQFANEPGYKEALDCSDRQPPGPYFQTSHAYEVATSNESLDMQRFNNFRMSCLHRGSRVCQPDFQAQMQLANTIAEGPERTAAMEAIADHAYEEVFFIPFFEVVFVYGMDADLEWEPYYAPRLRGNTLFFSK